MIQINLDLAGAEWVVVAYLANDQNMLGVVKSGESPHLVTGNLITGIPKELILKDHEAIGDVTDADEILKIRNELVPEVLDLQQRGHFLPRTMSIRQAGKKSNHALNYGMRYRRFAQDNEVPEADAKPLCEAYSTKAYPGLQGYWERVRQKLRKDRTLTNCFGRRVILLDEWGHELFMAGYSFEPQSTVVDTVNKALCLSYEDGIEYMEKVRLGAQVHDSLMFQYPENDLAGMAASILRVREHMRPWLEIGEHKFRLGCDVKIGRDWGHMKGVKTNDDDPHVLQERLAVLIPQLT